MHKNRTLEEQLVVKDDFRRVTLELQEKEHQQRMDKLLSETRDKLECIQSLKNNEIEC
jgi:hypothetical protein